ncbi:hypothetical protein M231_07032 [Tremella mesenterica]|uniref:Uncharacterized protein n=1 Tax=Tremella mesenterica TaxID=5217 RepID=A0A4Q1BD35_TREME|nr:hypothetical protein M231_07032 [Tremella mesenterica]
MSTTDEIVHVLFNRGLPPLEPGDKVWNDGLTGKIKGLKEHRFVVAALHLANDDIHNCHLISQDNEGDPTADLLHATLHRREGDYGNSKYWWSRVSHPLIPSITTAKSFVDACEVHAGSGSSEEVKLREKQWEEIKGLVLWTRENCH